MSPLAKAIERAFKAAEAEKLAEQTKAAETARTAQAKAEREARTARALADWRATIRPVTPPPPEAKAKPKQESSIHFKEVSRTDGSNYAKQWGAA